MKDTVEQASKPPAARAWPYAGSADQVRSRDLWFLGRGRDEVTRRIRAAQVGALIRLMPFTNLINLFNASLVALALYGEVASASLAVWLAVIALLAGVRAVSAWKVRQSVEDPARSPAAASVLVGAVLFAILWCVPPVLWFDNATTNQKLLIVMVVTGMMGGAASTLATVPPVAFAYITILGCAMISVDLRLGLPAVAAMSVAFICTLCSASMLNARQFVSHLRTRMELEEQSELIELLREFEASGSGWLWELDGDLNLIYMSRDMAEASGRQLQRALGLNARQLLDPTGRITGLSEGMRSVFQHFEHCRPFRDIAIPTSNRRWWCLSGKPLLDQTGRCIGWRGVGSDITEVRHSGTNSVRAARHDPLTGLANRLMIREQLEEALLRQEEDCSACSLLLVDLDRFKLVNDTLGHAVGDELLRSVAGRLRRCAGEGASVGRLGGDEFAILWYGAHEDSELAELSQMVIGQVSESYRIAGSELTIGATIGIASSPRDGCSQEELTRSADLALYRAKEAGRGSFQFYDATMVEEARWKRQLESDLRCALQQGGLDLAYQPFVDAQTGRVMGKEALLRWRHPEHGEIPPDLFVPVIEDVGLISQVGNWVIRQACAEAAAWPDDALVAVNVSAAQLPGPVLANAVIGALASSGLAAERLELEITETSFLSDDAATLDALEALRRLGVRLVLDDFGTGYSSFGYLARARFNKIKIDKSFVHAVSEGSRQASAIVEAIIALAHGLRLQITAEGVESAAQAALMRRLGCDLLQGFYFGRPAAPDAQTGAVVQSALSLERKRA